MRYPAHTIRYKYPSGQIRGDRETKVCMEIPADTMNKSPLGYQCQYLCYLHQRLWGRFLVMPKTDKADTKNACYILTQYGSKFLRIYIRASKSL